MTDNGCGLNATWCRDKPQESCKSNRHQSKASPPGVRARVGKRRSYVKDH